VLLDTFLVRTVTVPAIAWIVGDWNWWPSRAGRRAPASGVFEVPPEMRQPVAGAAPDREPAG
jgi:putative drug exporter of the RND superfamily